MNSQGNILSFIDPSRQLKLPYPGVAALMRASVPYGEFSNSFIAAVQESASLYVKEITLKCMEIKSLEQRETLQISDINEAIKILDLNKIQPKIVPNTDEEGNANPEEEPYIAPVEQSLYKKIKVLPNMSRIGYRLIRILLLICVWVVPLY